MAELTLQQVHKRFGDVVALKSLDLTIHSGEFVAFLGPSGCGKTTALRIVAGFESPDNGRVLVGGKDVTSVPANRRDMGMVFQAYSLFPNLTARENVAFGLRVRRTPRGEQVKRAAELLDLVGLSPVANRYPHQLSGGQQQRVALARALAIKPSVLLLDEPLSALDAKVRVQLREEIRRLQTQLGITALFVTHDQEEALSMADRVAVLSHGEIEQVGTPADIYGNPRTAFVAQFVGTMNRLTGTISPRGQGLVEYNGALLRAESAAGWAAGKSVLLLIRPEAIVLEKLAGDALVPEGGLAGAIRSHTFLGPVTRLKVDSSIGELTVDVGTTQALSLGEGARVALQWDPQAPRLIDLSDGGQEQIAEAASAAGRSDEPQGIDAPTRA